MRGILINPWDKTISEIEVGTKDAKELRLDDYYSTLSHPKHKVDCFTVVYVGDREVLYLDDEGLLKPGIPLWGWKGYGHFLAGNGLILGSNRQGDSGSTSLTLDYVKDFVVWTSVFTSGYNKARSTR